MLLPSTTLLTIQQAGQAVFDAQAAVQQSVQDHANQVAQALAKNAFGLENDMLFEDWKSVARFSQELQDIESRLKAMYETALALNNSEGLKVVNMPRLVVPTAKTKPRGARLIQARTGGRKAVGGNNAKVMAYLGKMLNHSTGVHITQAQIASGAGIPAGSVSIALHKLCKMKLIREAGGKKGSFLLV